MPAHNATGGYLPEIAGTVPRSVVIVDLRREHFSGDQDGSQQLRRDYCDDCLPEIWLKISSILAYERGAA
jgi:hypothetical protein